MKHRLSLLLVITFTIVFIISFETIAADNGTFFDMLTNEEKQYIEEAGIIPTIISPNKGPIQYLNSKGTQKGITVDVLEEISLCSNLKFEYISLSGLSNIQKSVNSEQVQIVAGIPIEHSLQDAYRVNFSKSYLNCTYGVILNRSNDLNNIQELTMALATGLDIPEQFNGAKEIKYYDSIQSCIDAVLNEEADFAYGNSYVLEFYSQGYKLQNLCIIPLVGAEQNICFGVSIYADQRLSSILNKAIAYIGVNGLTNILIKNVAASTQPITIATLISSNPKISILVCLLILLIIIFIAILMVGNYRLKNHKIHLEFDTLMEKSLCDSITGIYNAAATKKFIAEALKVQPSGAFFIIDLDYFKKVNDYFGHQVGDFVIKNTALILKNTFRKEDIIGRLGGDEFIVFTPTASDINFITMKSKQLQSLINEIKFPRDYCQTISIGIARASENSTFEQLYSQADDALYFVKERGRNNFHIAGQ